MLQNWSLSTESAHANTEASVSGHCLDSSGKSMKSVNNKEGIHRGHFSESERKWDFEFFCEVEMLLRLKQNLDLPYNNFTELKLDLKYFCPKRREKRNWT